MGEQIESVCIKKIRVDEGANIKYRFDELEGTKKLVYFKTTKSLMIFLDKYAIIYLFVNKLH